MNLASELSTRFQFLGNMEDLEMAIAIHHQALNLCPPGHSGRPLSFNGLGNAVYARFQHLRNIEDLEQAIAYHRLALDLDHTTSLRNLAHAVFTRFEHIHKISDLTESYKLYSEVENTLPPSHLNHATIRSALASASLRLCHNSERSSHAPQVMILRIGDARSWMVPMLLAVDSRFCSWFDDHSTSWTFVRFGRGLGR
jgi:tetratricopeptide (TPR) repeat protein